MQRFGSAISQTLMNFFLEPLGFFGAMPPPVGGEALYGCTILDYLFHTLIAPGCQVKVRIHQSAIDFL